MDQLLGAAPADPELRADAHFDPLQRNLIEIDHYFAIVFDVDECLDVDFGVDH